MDSKLIAAVLIVALAVASSLLIPYLMYPPAMLKLIHVDPDSELSRLPLSRLLIILVLNPFTAMARGNFSGVSAELRILESAYIPSGLRFIVDRFIQLMNGIASHLDRADSLMDRAEELIDSGRGVEAKPMLAEASGEIALANATYRELRLASDELTRAFSLPRSDVYARLNDLGRLIDAMHLRLLRLLDLIERQRVLIETSISIDAYPKTVWTGGRISVEGRLNTASGKALPGRRVAIIVDGVRVSEASTSWDGSFRIDVNLPYIYKRTIAVQARYTPTGDDAVRYKPSTSDAVEVDLLYIEPRLIVEPVGSVLPGRGFTLRGSVHSPSQLPYSSVKISWINSVYQVKLRGDGSFEARLDTPGDIPDGKYILRVDTPASGVFAPVEASLAVTVWRIPVNATVSLPSLALAGLSVFASGSFRAGGERLNATVNVYFAGREYRVESDGDFSIWLNLPLTLLSGYQAYRLRITPIYPWFSEAALEGSILVVNPLTVLASVGVMIALAVRAFGRRVVEPIAEAVAAEAKLEEAPGMAEAYFAPGEFRWLMDMYWEAVGMIGELTGVAMKPYMTMREYLAAVASSSHVKLYRYLETITSAAERALYSPEVSAWSILTAVMAARGLRAEYARAKS